MTKLEKVVKKLGDETVKLLDSLSVEQLKERIVIAETSMDEVQRDLDNNPIYQELIANKKALESGKREVNARQRAIIAYALHRISEDV